MIERFHAIVLKIVKHNDKIQIADVLTKEQGRMGLAIPAGSSASKRASQRILWRPLSLLEFDADLSGRSKTPFPKEVRTYRTFADIPYNPLKSMIAMFVGELLCGSSWSGQPDPFLYGFVEQSLLLLDSAERGYANFPIAFSIRLLRFLGLEPAADPDSANRFYDLLAAEYTAFPPSHGQFLRDDEARAVELFLRMDYGNMHHFALSRAQRQRTLEIINTYYMLHVPDFRQIKSLDVFRQTLS